MNKIFQVAIVSLFCISLNGFSKAIPRVRIVPSSAICKKRHKYLLSKWQTIRYKSLEALDPIERKFPPGTEVCINPKKFEGDVKYSSGKDLRLVRQSKHGFFSGVKILKVPVNKDMKDVTPYNLNFWNSMNLYVSKNDIYKKAKKSRRSLKSLVRKMKRLSTKALLEDCIDQDCKR